RAIASLRATPILVLTTENAPELKARARAAGATGWIVKPFEADKLLRALQMITG
ncbi:MAG: response regulator, partial [Alphaproteobacteria bacterium HGW-Alphaproteobacteria-16]